MSRCWPAFLLVMAAGCAELGVIDDGSSLSYGSTNRGLMVNAVPLPVRGDGYLIPSKWAERKLNWGTEELVQLIVRASRRVAREAPGARLYVADMSPRHGGASEWHKSHQAGRDADLLFFALDAHGKPAPPPSEMIRYDSLGNAGAKAERRFDVPRNWALVRALLEDPAVDVQFLFISAPLKALLLEEATSEGVPADLIERAAAIMLQPSDSAPHDDHLHVRVFCAANDRALGCHDRGPLRWFKKSYKYLQVKSVMPAPGQPLESAR